MTIFKFNYMKSKILLACLAISSLTSEAQTNNLYEIFGYKTIVVYETKISEMFKIINIDPTSDIKTLAYNVEEGFVLFLGLNDSVLSKVKIEPE